MLTIAAGLFVLGFFLMINANIQRIVGRWSDSAELAVYLREDAKPDQVATINQILTKSGLADSVQYVSRDEAPAASSRAISRTSRRPPPASSATRFRRPSRSG